jgi:glycosyltransferase involved in cell wall biosynthesis
VSAPWISVVVPAYNEQAGIARLIEALRERLGQLGRSYEIVVVDNASQDGTLQVLEPLLGERVRVLSNDVNRGKGFSVRRELLAARQNVRAQLHAARRERSRVAECEEPDSSDSALVPDPAEPTA